MTEVIKIELTVSHELGELTHAIIIRITNTCNSIAVNISPEYM